MPAKRYDSFDVLTLFDALALLTGLAVLWVVWMRAFIWVTFTIASFVPHIGRKHRHQRWDELNGPKAGV